MSEPGVSTYRTQASDFVAGVKPAHYYTEELLVPLSTWRHEKTGSTCTVLGVSTSAAPAPADFVGKVVVYVSHAHHQMCHLDVAQFLDGRFCPEPKGE